MPFASVTLKPGVDTESTPTLSRASYNTSSLGRFRAGLFEKLGGWVKFYFAALNGVPRALQAWQDLNGLDWLGIGTTASLDVINSGNLTDITPQTKTTDFAPKFSTTISSPNVTVDDSNISNVTTYDTIEFQTPVSVGGLILSGSYAISLILGTTNYQIVASSNATSSVTNGGAVPSFTTQGVGSSLVNVTLAGHGLSAGGTIVFPLSTSVGGVTISGTYSVVSVTSGNVFVIAAATTASSVATVSMNSGNAELTYYIAIGPVAAGTAYSFSTYSSGPYGGTGSIGSQQTGTNITATDWTTDNWGSTLLACPANGGIYQWTPSSGVQNAQLVSAAPIHNNGIFVATPYQILIALGSTVTKDIGIAQDALTWRGSDILDYTYWEIGTTNPSTGVASQAYTNRIPTGSAIKAGMATPNQVLLWTDLDLWSLNYLGPPLIWGQTKIGSNCGAISRHGVAQMAGVVYWWSANNFYALAGGAPTVIPCSVWDIVFQNIDRSNLDKCWVETVTSFNEVWFFYPSSSGGTGQCDSYAKVNVLDGSWDYGPLPRSIGIDQSVLGNPIMATPTGVLYTHESGYDADGQPLVSTFTTGYFFLSEGQDFVFCDKFYPDFKLQTASGSSVSAIVAVTFSVIDNVGDIPRTYGPYNMSTTTTEFDVRFRGRQVAITMTCSGIGMWFRLGKCRFRFGLSGRR